MWIRLPGRVKATCRRHKSSALTARALVATDGEIAAAPIVAQARGGLLHPSAAAAVGYLFHVVVGG